MPISKAAILDPELLRNEIVDGLLLSEELDQLFLSLNKLVDMNEEGEIDLILEQPGKSVQQKSLYIRKIIGDLYYSKLKDALDQILATDNLEFFSHKHFPNWINALQTLAEKCYVMRLTLAVNFKEPDLREMAEYLTEKVGRHVVLNLKIDRSLVGGAIVQHGNYISDYSVKTKLALYRSHWQKAVVNEHSR